MTVAAELLVRVGADTGAATREIASFRGGLENAAASMGRTGLALSAGITAPLVGAATAALKFSTDLNSAMANVASLGIASDRVIALKNDVQDMAIVVGKDTGDLADGLYQVISAFGDSADTAEILRINAVAAAAGLATTTDAINLTSAVTKGYGDTSAEAIQHVSDLAFKTVEMGQTTFPELANAMGKVVPLAAELGVSQEELFAVMATGTGVTGSASEVVTQMRGSLQALMAPTADMTRLYSSLGFSSGQAMLQQLGYAETMSVITQHARDTDIPLQKFMGSIEGQTLALALSGAQADTFAEKLAAMGDVTGAVDAAFLAQTDGINAAGFAYQQAMIQVQVLAERLGDALAPAFLVVLSAIEPLIDMLSNVVTWFSEADNSTQMAILAFLGIAAAAGPVLLALSGMAAGLAFLLSPIGLVIAGAAALGAAWVADFLGMRTATMNFIESVRGLVGVFQDARARGLNPFEAALLTVQTALDNLGLSGVSAALGNFAAATQEAWRRAVDFASNLDNWPDSLRGIAAAIGAGVTALGEFVSHVRDVIASSATLRAALVTLGRQGMDFLATRITALVSSAQARLEPLEAAFERISTIIAGIAAGDIEPAKEALRDAFDAIASFDMNAFISTLSSAGVDVSNAILNSFQQVDLPALRDTIIARLGLENFQLFPDGSSDALGNLPAQFAALGSSLSGLGASLAATDWSTVSVNTMGLVAAVRSQFMAIDWSGAASTVGGLREAIAQQLGAIDFRGMATAVLSEDNPLSRFFERARGVAETISAQMAGFGSAPLAERFERVVSSVLATVGLIGETRTDLILTATRYLSSLTTSLLEFGAGVVEGLDAEKIAAVLGTVATKWSEAFAAIFDDLSLFDMGAAAGKLGTAFVQKLTEILGAPGFAEEVGGAVGGAVVAMAQGAAELVSGLASQLKTADFGPFADASDTFVMNFAKGMIAAIAKMDFGDLGRELGSALVEAAVEHVKSMNPLDFFGPPGKVVEAGLEGAGVSVPTLGDLTSDFWPPYPKPEPDFWPDVIPPDSEWWPDVKKPGDDFFPDVAKPADDFFPSLVQPPDDFFPPVAKPDSDFFPDVIPPDSEWWPTIPQEDSSWWPRVQELDSEWWPGILSLDSEWWPDVESMTPDWWPSIDMLPSSWWPDIEKLTPAWWPTITRLESSWWPFITRLESSWWPSILRLPSSWWPALPRPSWLTSLLEWRPTVSIFGGGGAGGGGGAPEAFDGENESINRRWQFQSTPSFAQPVRAASMEMAGAGGVNVNFYGDVHVRDDSDIDRLATEVALKIQRMTRR